MNLANRIQAKTDNGDTVIDFLVEVMQDARDGFKICHRLDSARLLTKYGCSCKSAVVGKYAARAPDDAIDFILDNPPGPSRRRSNSGSSRETKFDKALAKAIRESTDDGDSVCRFLINVMEGELKAFGPQQSMAAARELLSRGFGKDAYQPDPGAQASRPQKAQTASHSSLLPLTPQRKPPPLTPRQRLTARNSDSRAATATFNTSPTPTPTHQPEPEANDGFDLDIYRAASKCPDPNFDPMLEATSDEYFWNHGGCDYPKCPYHGEPDDYEFDPEDFHY